MFLAIAHLHKDLIQKIGIVKPKEVNIEAALLANKETVKSLNDYRMAMAIAEQNRD